MKCKTRQEAVAHTAKIFMKDLKANTDFNSQKIREIAIQNAEDFVEQKIQDMKMADFEAQVDAKHQMPGGAVDELNAEKPRIIKDKTDSPVTVIDVTDSKVHVLFPDKKKVYRYDHEYLKLNQKDTKIVLAKYKPNVLFSNDHEATTEQAEEFYINYDGTISKSGNINNAMINLDKTNMKEDFDEEHSKHLTDTLNLITSAVKNIQDLEVNIAKSTSSKDTYGMYDRLANEISLRVDDKLNRKRTPFTQTNQELYVHELVHAVTEFLFDGSLSVGKNPEIVGLLNSVRSLYATASRKVKSSADLIKLLETSRKLTPFEKEQAKDVYEYIFNNKDANGIEEFMTYITTNKLFKDAMSNIEAFDVKNAPEDAHIVDKLISKFRDLVAKLVGFVTHTKKESITVAGEDLVYKIIKANFEHSKKSVMQHPLKPMEDASKIVGKVLDKADSMLEEPVNKAIDTILMEPLKNYLKKANSAEIDRLERTLERAKADGVDTEAAEAAVKKAKDAAIKYAKSKETKVLVEQLIKTSEGEASRNAFINKMLVEKPNGIISKSYNTIINSLSILNSLATAIWAAGKLRRLKEIDAKGYAKAMSKFRTILNKIEENAIANAIKDFFDKDKVHNAITDAILTITHAVDKMREGSYEEVLEDTADWFGKIPINSKDYESQNKALTDVLLRTDIQSLGLDAKGLEELLREPERVSKKIAELQAVVKKLGSEEMLEDVELAVKAMVFGTSFLTNAHNIASKFGREHSFDESPSKELVDAIDKLISYKAFKATDKASKEVLLGFLNGDDYESYTEPAIKKLATKVNLIDDTHLSKAEYTKQVKEGINNFINFSRGAQEASKIEMKETPHHIIKGYMKETFDSGIEIVYRPIRDTKEMENMGFKLVKIVNGSFRKDVDYGMFSRLDGKRRRVNGAIGLQSTKHRGFTLSDSIEEDNKNTNDGSKKDYIQRRKTFKKMFNKALREYNKNRAESEFQPVYNSKGQIVDFRISMSLEEKAKYLDMEAKGTQNLARTYGVFGTAAETLKHNKEAIDILKADADKNYKGNEDDYVIIRPRKGLIPEDFGLEVNDEIDEHQSTYEELWARLPKSTQDYAASLYGKDGKTRQIIVRKDLIRPAFGEDEVTITDFRLADNFSQKVRAKMTIGEKYWQDLMQIAKTNIVIKMPAVFIGNIMSNAKLLYYIGVNPIKGVKLLTLGARELHRYRQDEKALHRLQRKRLTMNGNTKAIDNKIKQLQELLNSNTVAPLIDKGLFQSIVEDVAVKQDTNRISSKANELLDKYVPNKTLNTAIQYAFLTENTKPFQAMLKATQVSDFYFRYAQYYDAIDKANTAMDKAKTLEEAYTIISKYSNNPDMRLSGYKSDKAELYALKHSKFVSEDFEAKAMRDIIDNYINYEDPLEKHIRYGDKMGPWFFVRFFTKIQRVNKKIAKTHPGRLATELATEYILGDTDGIEDASILSKGFNTYNFEILGHIGDASFPAGLELLNDYLH